MTIFPEEITSPSPLESFKGKVCTILVDRLASFQSKLNNEEITQSFTGYVNYVNSSGICITDLVDKTRNWFYCNHIVMIREEKVFDPNNPEDREEIAIIQKAMELKNQLHDSEPPKDPVPSKVDQMESIGKESAFVNISDLQLLAKKSKNL